LKNTSDSLDLILVEAAHHKVRVSNASYVNGYLLHDIGSLVNNGSNRDGVLLTPIVLLTLYFLDLLNGKRLGVG
jgi:hypothetical protein